MSSASGPVDATDKSIGVTLNSINLETKIVRLGLYRG
jgi:hypothetical protein